MTKTSAHALTPKSPRVDNQPASNAHPTSDNQANPGSVTLGLAITMAWQLFVVVLVPIIGGALLDTKLKSSPTWTVVGMAVAVIGMIVVVRRTVIELNEYMKNSAKDKNDQ